MTTITNHLGKSGIEFNKQMAYSVKAFLLLAFLNFFILVGAFAQPSCSVTGVAASPPYPPEVIVSCANGPNLSY